MPRSLHLTLQNNVRDKICCIQWYLEHSWSPEEAVLTLYRLRSKQSKAADNSSNQLSVTE